MSEQNLTSGILVVDKPQGVTSHDIVAALRGALHTKRVGHAGTLDPMATGVLVIGFGQATKLLNYIVEHTKTYQATIRLGQTFDTDDATGKPIPATESQLRALSELVELSDSERLDVIHKQIHAHFMGDIMQVPNAFSAIKINGTRAYDLAREGQEVALKSRPIHVEPWQIHDMRVSIFNAETPNGVRQVTGFDLDVTISCSAGTYIRALARDLGAQLGVGGHLTRLRRTSVGDFSLESSPTVTAHVVERVFRDKEGVEQKRNKAVIDADYQEIADKCALNLVDAAVRTLPSVELNEQQAQDVRFGRRIKVDAPTLGSHCSLPKFSTEQSSGGLNPQQSDAIAAYCVADNVPQLVAIMTARGKIKGKTVQLQPVTVFAAE